MVNEYEIKKQICDIGRRIYNRNMVAANDGNISVPEAVIALGCVPIAEYGTPSTMEIPDNLEKYLPYFDAVLLENHGALTWSTDLNAAYMKMESVEFYAQLLYQSKLLGGPKEFDKENIRNFMRSVVNSVCLENIRQAFARTKMA